MSTGPAIYITLTLKKVPNLRKYFTLSPICDSTKLSRFKQTAIIHLISK